MKKLIALALCTSTLFGCAVTQPLSAKNKGKYITLNKDLTESKTWGLFSVTWTDGISSGVYFAEAQNDNGIFYGSKECSINIGNQGYGKGDLHGLDCGVWVPNNNSGVVRTYYHETLDIPSTIDWYEDFPYKQFDASLGKKKESPSLTIYMIEIDK